MTDQLLDQMERREVVSAPSVLQVSADRSDAPSVEIRTEDEEIAVCLLASYGTLSGLSAE